MPTERADAGLLSLTRQPVLLMAGACSPPPVHRGITRLAAMLPHPRQLPSRAPATLLPAAKPGRSRPARRRTRSAPPPGKIPVSAVSRQDDARSSGGMRPPGVSQRRLRHPFLASQADRSERLRYSKVVVSGGRTGGIPLLR
jgi:hypothetical protein